MRIALLMILAMTLASCTSLRDGWQDVTIAALDASYLQQEFDDAGLIVLDLPLPPADKAIVQAAIEELDTVRQELGGLEATGNDIALGALMAPQYYQRIKGAYIAGRNAVVRYYNARDVPVPVRLLQYDSKAQGVSAVIEAQLAATDVAIDVSEFGLLLRTALQAYAANKGIPAI